MTFAELLRETTKDTIQIYYEKSTGDIGDVVYFNRKYRTGDGLIPKLDLTDIIPLPTYNDLNHKEIWSNYVKAKIDDKEIRTSLFNALRNDNYYDKFRDLIKKYKLETEFIDYVDKIYYNIFYDWVIDNKVEKYMDKALKHKNTQHTD